MRSERDQEACDMISKVTSVGHTESVSNIQIFLLVVIYLKSLNEDLYLTELCSLRWSLKLCKFPRRYNFLLTTEPNQYQLKSKIMH